MEDAGAGLEGKVAELDAAGAAPEGKAEEQTAAMSAGAAPGGRAEEQEDALSGGASEAMQEQREPGVECYSEYKDGFHDRLAKHWPHERGQLHAGGRSITRQMIDDVGEETFTTARGFRVLDLCCGEGATVCELAAKYPNVTFTGIDIVPSAIDAARRAARGLANATFELGSIFKMDMFSNGSFDLVLGQDPDGFSHPDRRVAFEEAYRVLKLGGQFYIHHHWIPGFGWDAKDLEEQDAWSAEHGFTTAKLRAEVYVEDCEAAGFVVDTKLSMTELALSHFAATAANMEQRQGAVQDEWLARSLKQARSGKAFGAKIIAHRETLMELVSLNRWSKVHAFIDGMSTEDILKIRDPNGWSLLHLAAKEGDLGTVQLLVEQYNVPVTTRDGNGCHPIYRSVGYMRQDVTKYLIKMGSDMRHINDDSCSILHNSTYSGDDDLSYLLLHGGLCDPLKPDRWGCTPVLYGTPGMPGFVREVFDTRITEITRYVKHRLNKYDFKGLSYGENMDGVDSIIRKIVDCEVSEVLKHQLTYQYFRQRWVAFAARKCYGDIVEHFLDVAVLVAFALVLRNLKDEASYSATQIALSVALIVVAVKNLKEEAEQWYEATLSPSVFFGYTFNVKKYWSDAWNWCEITNALLAIAAALAVLVAAAIDGDLSRYAGSGLFSDFLSISILLYSIRTLKLISLFRTFGPYIRSLFKMSKDVVVFAAFGLIFLVGFSLCFFVRFGDGVGNIWDVHLTVLESLVVGDTGRVRDAITGSQSGVLPNVLYVLMLLALPLMLANVLIAMINTTYQVVQYRAVDEWLVLWARFVLEVQAHMKPEECSRLLKQTAVRSFHAAPAENMTAIDTHALAKGVVFDGESFYVWEDITEKNKEDTLSLLFLRDEMFARLDEMEHRFYQLMRDRERREARLQAGFQIMSPELLREKPPSYRQALRTYPEMAEYMHDA